MSSSLRNLSADLDQALLGEGLERRDLDGQLPRDLQADSRRSIEAQSDFAVEALYFKATNLTLAAIYAVLDGRDIRTLRSR